MNPAELALVVQYQVDAPELPRWRLRRWVQQALNAASEQIPDLRGAQITLRLVDADEGQQLNQEFRGRDYATNVLTFEYGQDPNGICHGDVVLCLPVMAREAQEQGKSPAHHAAHLVIHGVLHAVGYDHMEPDEAQLMEALETRILARMGIADPYTT